jgi:hypothetical protein
MAAPLHVIFSQAAEPDLRAALALAGRSDEVAVCFDIFSLGPIDPGDRFQRQAWLSDVLDLGPEGFGSDDLFWRQALALDRPLIAWTSTRVAQERAGFLEWLRRLGDAPCAVIDLSEARDGSAPAILGILDAEKILSLGLLDLARPLEAAERHGHHETWRRLRAENAPLRTIQDGELASAALTAFDQQLLSHVTADWARAARAIGGVLADAFDDHVLQVNDFVLMSRLGALIKAGAIEARPLAHPRGLEGPWAQEIRLPSGPGQRD